MITYTEKGAGLHAAIGAAGLALWCADNVWCSTDDAAVQAIIDAYTLDDARAPVIELIKDSARLRILAFLPDWKQSNLNARMNELNLTRFTRELVAEELSEIAAMQAIWNQAKAIRQASNDHEAALNALASFEAVAAYDISAGWPG